MRQWVRGSLLGVVVAWLTIACAAPQGPAASQAPSIGQADRVTVAGPKRITVAIRGIPALLSQAKTLRSVGSVPGLDALQELVHAGLVHVNDQGTVLPQLAEAAPTIENGLWKILPDGRMETTWRIRESARWQDGTPVTTDDLLFTTQVEQDDQVAIPRYAAYDLIESIEALDRSTIIVRWSQPYIEADLMFGYEVGLPMPKHLLEPLFTSDKANFLGAPYWTEQFVGAGPFHVKEWVVDSHVVLRAYDGYVLGRPKIDEIEVKFIPDPTTLLANILAGVEMTIGRNVSLEQALEVRDQWDGRILTRMSGWMPINVQFVNANPPIVTNLEFRRALLRGIDRRQMMDSIMAGQGDIAHSFVSSDLPDYPSIEPRIVKYAYEPQRTALALEGLGYQKRADGFLYDAAGQRLSVSIYSTVQNALHAPATAIVSDSWQRLGIAVEQVMIPIQRARDREYRAQFPAFELVQTSNGLQVSRVMRFHSSSTPLPENRFQVTGNNSRYRNTELDRFIERYVTTVPKAERMQALAGIVNHQTENLSVIGLLFHMNPTLVHNRIQNVTVRGDLFTESWNAHEWDVRS